MPQWCVEFMSSVCLLCWRDWVRRVKIGRSVWNSVDPSVRGADRDLWDASGLCLSSHREERIRHYYSAIGTSFFHLFLVMFIIVIYCCCLWLFDHLKENTKRNTESQKISEKNQYIYWSAIILCDFLWENEFIGN